MGRKFQLPHHGSGHLIFPALVDAALILVNGQSVGVHHGGHIGDGLHAALYLEAHYACIHYLRYVLYEAHIPGVHDKAAALVLLYRKVLAV